MLTQSVGAPSVELNRAPALVRFRKINTSTTAHAYYAFNEIYFAPPQLEQFPLAHACMERHQPYRTIAVGFSGPKELLRLLGVPVFDMRTNSLGWLNILCHVPNDHAPARGL